MDYNATKVTGTLRDHYVWVKAMLDAEQANKKNHKNLKRETSDGNTNSFSLWLVCRAADHCRGG
jgi:hypothetical protein